MGIVHKSKTYRQIELLLIKIKSNLNSIAANFPESESVEASVNFIIKTFEDMVEGYDDSHDLRAFPGFLENSNTSLRVIVRNCVNMNESEVIHTLHFFCKRTFRN